MHLKNQRYSCAQNTYLRQNRGHVPGYRKRYAAGIISVCILLLSFGSLRVNAQATPNPDCTIILPANPLTAKGLSTPFQLTATDPANGPCNEANPNQSAFVQAGIFDPATGTVSVYTPLVIDEGTKPAVAPIVPTLPAHAIVALWFGSNGNTLTQKSSVGKWNLEESRCVNGLHHSIFGQYSYCNAPEFFHAVRHAIRDGKLKVPALGVSPKDNQPCPTSRSFRVVDQDQSDNLPVSYLISADGLLAQNNTANAGALAGATVLANGSDERLVSVAMDKALGCTPWTAPDLSNPGQVSPSLPLNELLASNDQATPVALVPAGDPMTMVNTHIDLEKVDLYRLGVDQPVADSFHDVDTARYCRQLLRIAPQSYITDQAIFTAAGSPMADAANNLLNFLGQRFVATYQILNCEQLTNKANPVSVTTDANGVAISTTVNALALNQIIQDLAAEKASDDQADSAERSRRSFE